MPHYEPKHLFDSPNEDPAEYPQMMDFIVRIESLQAKGLGDFLAEEYLSQRYDARTGSGTILDWGCGPGIYLLPYKERGWTIRGFDACPTAGQSLEPDEFRRWDARFQPSEQPLFDGLDWSGWADLSICFEVAEHLEEHWADRLVDTLCEHSSAILFTAATPGQGGSYHYNEQPHEYWLNKFKDRHNFVVSDFQPKLKEFLEKWRPLEQQNLVCGWLIQNVYLLEKR